MADLDNLILEVHWNRDHLKMSIGGRNAVAETVRYYTRRPVSLEHVARLCRETLEPLSAVRGGRMPPEALRSLERGGLMLWDQLLTAPVKAVLKSSPPVQLSLLLDEELTFIPWELIFDGSEFLALKFGLGRLIGSRSPRPPLSRPERGRLKMLVLANPTGDLRSAYEEGMAVRRRLEAVRGTVAVDFKSTEIDSFYVRRSLREYDLVHFAGHSEYDPADPSRTGWVLSDARLTAGDILAMGGDLPMPALVFSNSCHSARIARGAGEEDYQRKTYSLASAFLFSGVRHFLGTVHMIEDSAGPVFAAEFYARLCGGCPIGEAVRGARQAVIRQQGREHISWTKYILYGDPGHVLSFAPAPVEIAQVRPPGFLRPRAAVAAALGVFLAVFLLRMWEPFERMSLHSARALLKSGRCSEAVASCEDLVKKGRFPDAHLVMAEALARMGRNGEAIRQCFDYIVNSGGKNPSQAVDALVRIGWFYQQSGDYGKAHEFYARALKESRERGDKLGESSAMRKLAVWQMDKGDNNKALELLTKCLEIDRERQSHSRHRYNMACDYFDMGLVFCNKDELETAKDFYRKSARLFEQMRLTHEESDYHFNMGEIYLIEKRYQPALESYLKGLRIDLAMDNKPAVAADYNMLGELYAQMEQPGRALEYFQKAVSAASRIQSDPVLAAAFHNLGLFYKEKKDKAGAREWLRRAEELYRKMGLPDAGDVAVSLKEVE